MADRNTGAWIRAENGADILVAPGSVSDGTDSIKNLVPGSLEYMEPDRERIVCMDRGVQGPVIGGDERPARIRFRVRRTPDSDALQAILQPALVNGLHPYFTVTLKLPNYLGSAAGSKRVYNKCFVPDDVEHRGSDSGQSADEISYEIVHAGPKITPTTY